MPKFTADELLSLQNPYTILFANGDSYGHFLTENRDEIENLSHAKKISLATNIVLDCSSDNLSQISSFIVNDDTSKGFDAILGRAVSVRQRMEYINNEANPDPYKELLGGETFEFDPAPFHEFSTLSQAIANKNGTVFASNLAITTFANNTKELMSNIRNTFPGTSFSTNMGRALLLNKLLTDLKGNNPEQVLMSRDFSLDLFNQFPKLVVHQLKGDAPLAIANKLIASGSEIGKIAKILETLIPTAQKKDHPFAVMHVEFCRLAIARQEKQRAAAEKTNVVLAKAEIQPEVQPEVKSSSSKEVLAEKPVLSTNANSFFNQNSNEATTVANQSNDVTSTARPFSIKKRGHDDSHDSDDNCTVNCAII